MNVSAIIIRTSSDTCIQRFISTSPYIWTWPIRATNPMGLQTATNEPKSSLLNRPRVYSMAINVYC